MLAIGSWGARHITFWNRNTGNRSLKMLASESRYRIPAAPIPKYPLDVLSCSVFLIILFCGCLETILDWHSNCYLKDAPCAWLSLSLLSSEVFGYCHRLQTCLHAGRYYLGQFSTCTVGILFQASCLLLLKCMNTNADWITRILPYNLSLCGFNSQYTKNCFKTKSSSHLLRFLYSIDLGDLSVWYLSPQKNEPLNFTSF